ncbi:hypothetical protein B0T19DRAFT_3866 [Cercophora scortea]|uniref:Uncharacterized protein n=1 Tax=Cercophora scortea TaxID=314031 RepID=A0AAE0J2X7_9PEZI|nr:hypothetical protein B0T19DRAFT_3866 [Cercophora scortea]
MPLPDEIRQFIEQYHFELPNAVPPDTAENIAEYPHDKRVEYIKRLLDQNAQLQAALKGELTYKFYIALVLIRIEVQLKMPTEDSRSHQQFLALEHALAYLDQKGFETSVAAWTNEIQREILMTRICAIFEQIKAPEIDVAFNEIARFGSTDRVNFERLVTGATIRPILSLWDGTPNGPTGPDLLKWIDDDLAMRLAGVDSEDPQDLIKGPGSFLTNYFRGQLTEEFQASYARRLRRVQRRLHNAGEGDGGRGHTSKSEPSPNSFMSMVKTFKAAFRGKSLSRKLKEPPRRKSTGRAVANKHPSSHRPKSRAATTTTRHTKSSKGKEKPRADPSSSSRHAASSSSRHDATSSRHHATTSSPRHPPSSSRRPPESPTASPQRENVISVRYVPARNSGSSSRPQAVERISTPKGKEVARPPSPAPSIAASVKTNVTVWPGPRPNQTALAAARAAVRPRPDSTSAPPRRDKKSSPPPPSRPRGRSLLSRPRRRSSPRPATNTSPSRPVINTSPPPPARNTSPLVSPTTIPAQPPRTPSPVSPPTSPPPPPIPPSPIETPPASRRSSWTTMRPPPDTPSTQVPTNPRRTRPQGSTLMAPTAASLRRQAEATTTSSGSPNKRPSGQTLAARLRTARTAGRQSSSSLRNSATVDTVGLGITTQPEPAGAEAPPTDRDAIPETTASSSRQPLDNPIDPDTGKETPQATPASERDSEALSEDAADAAHVAGRRIPRKPLGSSNNNSSSETPAPQTPLLSRQRMRREMAPSPGSTQVDLLSQMASPGTDARRRGAMPVWPGAITSNFTFEGLDGAADAGPGKTGSESGSE